MDFRNTLRRRSPRYSGRPTGSWMSATASRDGERTRGSVSCGHVVLGADHWLHRDVRQQVVCQVKLRSQSI